MKIPVFKFDDEQPDFKKALEKAQADPSSVPMSELERKAEDHIRDVGAEYADMSLEDIAKKQEPGKVSDRADAHAHLFVSEPLITEIWLIEMLEGQAMALYAIFKKHGGQVAIESLLSGGVIIAPHMMLFQKYRQLHCGRRSDGALQFWVFWSDKKLQDDLAVTVRREHATGLHRRPLYYCPTVQAVVAKH